MWGDVIAGPNVFIASMKRPETTIKVRNTKKPTERGSSGPFVPPVLRCCFDFLLIFNSGHLHRGSVGSASPAYQTPCSLERSLAGH